LTLLFFSRDLTSNYFGKAGIIKKPANFLEDLLYYRRGNEMQLYMVARCELKQLFILYYGHVI